MNALSTGVLAMAMSTDAFAAAIGKGSALDKPRWSEALRTGLIFGVIEGLTPLVGWLLGRGASGYVEAWDHWIAFVLLVALGVRMVTANVKAPAAELPRAKPSRHAFWLLAVTGFATSIDAMIVGVSLAFLDVAIVPVAVAIGICTFAMVTLGVMVGRGLGTLVGRRAEILGGLVLIGIGVGILVQHLGDRGAAI